VRVAWTDERTALLTKLVAENQSSNKIAGVMCISRNAVVGKVTRLGLKLTGGYDGRLHSRKPTKALKEPGVAHLEGTEDDQGGFSAVVPPELYDKPIGMVISKSNPVPQVLKPVAVKKSAGPGSRTHNVTRLQAIANGSDPGLTVDFEYDQEQFPVEDRKSLLELTSESCRFPVGDPRDKAFFFCGREEADMMDKQPYCLRCRARAFVGARSPAASRGYFTIPRSQHR
jgi:GcrA cell cycle regulator